MDRRHDHDTPMNNRPSRVAIVGGGPGGLFTAWHLERQGTAPLDITIFEQQSRLGGKVLSPAFSAAPLRYEAGAAEFYDYSPVESDPLRHLVRSLGLTTVPLSGAAVHMGSRWIANLDDLGDALGADAREAVSAFDRRARSAMTRRDFYSAGTDEAVAACPWRRFDDALSGLASPSARHYLEALTHSDLATESDATTAGYGLQNYLMNDPAYMRLYRIDGGNEQLVSALAGRLSARVRLGTHVTEVGDSGAGHLVLQWHEDGRLHCDGFDFVVLALPVTPLAALRFSDPLLDTAMRAHLSHHDHPAHYLRITLLLDRPVAGVPDGDDYVMLDAFGGACLYVESARHPTATHGVLGWLLGGAAAADMADLPDDSLVAAALGSLPASMVSVRDHVLESRVHRWIAAVSAVPGGWEPVSLARRHRPSPAHPGLFVVGDYLFDSTLNGVFDSAEYAAAGVTMELDRGAAA